MFSLSEERKGEQYTFYSALLWGMFPVFVVLSYSTVPSLVSLGWSTILAACFFGGLVFYKQRASELKNIALWKNSLAVAFFIGVLFYGLYFIGLETTTPGNAAIITLFEILTSFVFFRVLRGEKLATYHIAGAVLVSIGALIVLGRGFSGIHVGDFVILFATLFTPAGNYFQQRARQIASAESLMFLRSLLSVPPIFLLAYILGQETSWENVVSSWHFLLITGVLMLGFSKVFWIEAIHRISVTKALALSSVAPFFTLLFAWIILNQTPAPWQLFSLVPFVFGVLLLTDQITFKTPRLP